MTKQLDEDIETYPIKLKEGMPKGVISPIYSLSSREIYLYSKADKTR